MFVSALCYVAETSHDLHEASRKLSEAESELEGLNKERSDINTFKKGSFDFGPNELFFPLAGR